MRWNTHTQANMWEERPHEIESSEECFNCKDAASNIWIINVTIWSMSECESSLLAFEIEIEINLIPGPLTSFLWDVVSQSTCDMVPETFVGLLRQSCVIDLGDRMCWVCWQSHRRLSGCACMHCTRILPEHTVVAALYGFIKQNRKKALFSWCCFYDPSPLIHLRCTVKLTCKVAPQ